MENQKPMTAEERREKARLASKAYREKNKEEYKKKNLERYYKNKEKKALEAKIYDLSGYPEEARPIVEKYIKRLKTIKEQYPELLALEL